MESYSFLHSLSKPEVNVYLYDCQWYMQLKVDTPTRYITFVGIQLDSLQCQIDREISRARLPKETGTISFCLASPIKGGSLVTIEEKPRKMTLQQIEERLGHPIELIK